MLTLAGDSCFWILESRTQHALIYGFRPSGQRCLDMEEFNIVCDLNEAVNQERYKDAGTLPLSLPAHLCYIFH